MVPHNTWLKLVGYSSCGEQWISEYKVAVRFQSYRGILPSPPSSPDYPFTSNLFFASFSYSIVLGNERRVVDISTNVKSYRVSCLRDYTYILYVSIVSLQVLRFFLFSLSFSLFFFCFFNASNFVVVVVIVKWHETVVVVVDGKLKDSASRKSIFKRWNYLVTIAAAATRKGRRKKEGKKSFCFVHWKWKWRIKDGAIICGKWWI